ncbi:MAG: glucosamine-6-phosphate deaminase [Planctomycetaceae bacterium]|nr:glucosamine-6-phosphate deaminase [Planctomycetaceae bacterium]
MSEIIREFRVDKLQVKAYSTRELMGHAAGRVAAEAITKAIARQGAARVVFAAAPSQNETLATLTSDTSVDWSKVTAFHMDEYIGLPEDAPQRFSRYLKERVFSRVPLAAVHLLGLQPPERECGYYANLLAEKPIDVVCLGIGENGHIAFNDPPVADFNDPQLVKIVTLDVPCRQQQVNDGCFPDIGAVPETAVTLTIPALMRGATLICTVPGTTKRNAVRATLYEEFSTRCPATILRTHDDCTLFLDADSYPDR